MICTSCKNQLRLGAKFCGQCGVQNSSMSAHTLEILSVEGIGPDADGDLSIEIKFSVTNKSGLDWDQLTTRTQIVNELGHIEETSDTHEEVIEDGDSKELSINFYGVKGKSFLVAPEKTKTVIHLLACRAIDKKLEEIEVPAKSFDIVKLKPEKIDETLELISGAIWRTDPDDDKDVRVEARWLVKNLTSLSIPTVQFTADVVSKTGAEIGDVGSYEELRPSSTVLISGSTYDKERKISGSKVTMSLRVLATVSSGSFEHLGMGFVEAGESSIVSKSSAWPFATSDDESSEKEEDDKNEITTEPIDCGGSFEISIFGRGGEIVIGQISKDKYDYWNSRDSDELDEHLGNDGENGDVPEDCSLREWSDQDGIAHCSGPEFDTGETRISVTNASGEEIWQAKCDSESLNESGIEVECESSMEIYELTPGYYFCGKAFEKGTFFSATHESQVFDPTKLKFVIRNVNGWNLLDEAYYDDESLAGKENSSTRTNGSEFYVEESEASDGAKQESDEDDESESESDSKRIYIKTEPGGRILFGKLDETESNLLQKSYKNKEMNEELLDLKYNSSGGLREYDGVVNSGEEGESGNEGIISIHEDGPIEIPKNKNGNYEDGAYIVYLSLSKVSIEFTFKPSDGIFDSDKFAEVSVPIDLPEFIEHELYGRPEFNIVTNYLYDGEIIEEYDHELVDRGYEDLTSFFVVKNGMPKLIYSNYNGDETWH